MAGVSLDISLRGDVRVANKLRSARAALRDMRDLMNGVAVLAETQTKRRIMDEKTGPDGSPWDAWSPEYARTRSSRHSLLVNNQELHDSIEGTAYDDFVTVGSDKVYAGVMNYQRPFLGLSRDNRDEILQVVDDWLDGLL